MTTRTHLRSKLPVVVVVMLIATFCAGVGLGQLPGLPGLRDLIGGGSPLDRSRPTLLTIPSLDVRATVVEVLNADDGSIATPDGDPVRTTGWYARGATPGEAGTAVIVGHVDTADEPAVFARLSEARKGTVVDVARQDSGTVRFVVNAVRAYPKTAFPAGEVFANGDRPRLVLVTCGGEWLGGDIGYAENVIAFATLA
jgi:Sortase domain